MSIPETLRELFLEGGTNTFFKTCVSKVIESPPNDLSNIFEQRNGQTFTD